MQNTNKNVIRIGFIVLAVLIIIGIYHVVNRNWPDVINVPGREQANNQDGMAGTPAKPGMEQSTSTQPKAYSGTFYSFTYPGDWGVRETNRSAGTTLLFPSTLAKQAADNTISTTDSIKISLVESQGIDLTEAPMFSANGNTWKILNKKGTPEGGTANESLEYYAPLDRDTYVVIVSGSGNRSMIETLIQSFDLK